MQLSCVWRRIDSITDSRASSSLQKVSPTWRPGFSFPNLRDLRVPVLALVDADPYGLKIISVYMQGSKNMAFDSANLTTPDIKWLGVRPSDLDKFQIPEQCRLDMSAKDIETGQHMLTEEFIQQNPEWVKEVQILLESKTKAEIQALSSYGFQYLSEVYLPIKLQEGDWI